MTDIDMSTGSTVDYLVALIVFWTVFVATFLVYVRYIWPVVDRVYWGTAKKLYWVLREYCAKDGYDGYQAHNNRKGWTR